jgi:alpha-maltose-1-phosphate synthase
LGLTNPITLASFGNSNENFFQENLKVKIHRTWTLLDGNILNPFSLGMLPDYWTHDIIHAHQINTMVADLSCLAGRFLGKKVFLTDHGGGGAIILNKRLPVHRGRVQVVLQSEFTRRFVPACLQKGAVVIRGGVDVNVFCPDSSVVKESAVLFVGRILPHKGIDVLILR